MVAGLMADGSSGLISDSTAPRSHDYASVPGLSDTLVWAVSPRADGAHHQDLTPVVANVPGPGEAFVRVVRIPPDTVFASPDFDPARAEAESRAVMGNDGGVEVGEGGLHRTPSFDLLTVVSGRLTLWMSNGDSARVAAGDVVVQLAGMHRWSNETNEDAVLFLVHVSQPDGMAPPTPLAAGSPR